MNNTQFLDYNGLLYFYSLLNNKFLKSETDPTVPAWAKAPTKPSYTISEINGGASTASPEFTGIPTAPTATAGTNTTLIATTEFVSTAVSNAMAGVTSISYEVIAAGDDLPSTGTSGVIYLKPNSGVSGNSYDEYIWVNNTYELLSQKELDLSDYWNSTNLTSILNSDILNLVYPTSILSNVTDEATIMGYFESYVAHYNYEHFDDFELLRSTFVKNNDNEWSCIADLIGGTTHLRLTYNSPSGLIMIQRLY